MIDLLIGMLETAVFRCILFVLRSLNSSQIKGHPIGCPFIVDNRERFEHSNGADHRPAAQWQKVNHFPYIFWEKSQ